MPVLRALWRLIKRDYFTVNVVVLKSQCGDLCSIAVGIAQKTGLNAGLCNANGNFGSAMLDVYACANTGETRTIFTESLSTVSELQPALSYCKSSSFLQALEVLSSSQAMLTSSMCSAYYAVGSTPTVAVACPAGGTGTVVVVGGDTSLLTTAINGATPVTSTSIRTTLGSASSPIIETVSSSTLVTGSSAVVSTITAILPSATPIAASDVGLSKGGIAGVAFGGTVALFLLIASIVYFAWWYRCKHRNRSPIASGKKQLQGTEVPEKAQLHSDDYKPRRKELVGSTLPMHVRTIEGLYEVDPMSIRSEMDVNEVAAAELDRTSSDRIGTDSTLVDSDTSTRHGRQD